MTIKYKASQLSPMKLVFLFTTFNIILTSHSQIVVGDEDPNENEEKKPRTKSNRDSLSGTTFYLTGLFNYGHRSFTDRSVYGTFSDWNDQKADISGGATIGMFLPINEWLSLDLGFTYFGHKEQFNYQDASTDSTYSFTNTYMQIGTPIKLRYTYGHKFQVFGFAGLTPVNILNVRFNENYTRKTGEPVESETLLLKDKVAIFNLFATTGIGISYNFDWLGITFYPEYRHHLLNTYESVKLLDHKMFGLALNMGLTLRF